MADGVSFDFSQIDSLATALDATAPVSRRNIRAALNTTSLKIKRTWQGKAQGSPTLGGIARAINYDITSESSPQAPISSEIGIEVGKAQGSLGFISEYGSPTSPPKGYGLASLNENEADFQRGIEIAIDQALNGLGS
ncbi:hypothetical protein [Subtercola sp. RTI3]|uniref:hypothetical protein n=1 Tax=Subtercola sp. RTI3 TaxID=3048639 RepID=UPI002B230675|nr:hypothetical protein [Subtercola sp. RTI3]MEA9983650.1 hypothetical protein [Subtercola sp. RTI3]